MNKSSPPQKKKKQKKEKFELKLNKEQLEHLRDLFNIVIPPETTTTVSEALAATENRKAVEVKLWDKLEKLCVKAGLGVKENAPDFIITMQSHPRLDVYKLGDDECCDEGCEDAPSESSQLFK